MSRHVVQDPNLLREGRDPSQGTQRARQLHRYVAEQQDVQRESVGPARDEHHVASLQKQSFGSGGRTSFGVVIFSSPYTNWYRVQLDDLGSDLPCCMMSETSSLPFSVRDASPIPPRTPVLVYHQRELAYGIILGCLPGVVPEGVPTFSDWISQGSNGGFRRERYYSEFPQLFAKAGGQIDFSNQKPVDSGALGEWGKFSDLGGGFFLDPLMAYMRMDETCGLYLFYMDRLARLTGHNFDFRSAVSEQQIRLDVAESAHYTGSTPYGWEAMGLTSPGLDAVRVTEDAAVHFSAPYGKVEPANDLQVPVYRLEEFRGYEGQGYMRQLSLPRNLSSESPRVPTDRQQIGVFREQLALDGGYAIASRHSLTIAKRSFIEAPARLKQPDDQTGDDIDTSGYKFAGVYGNGPEHVIADSVPPGETLPHVLSASAVLDAAAYTFNWKALHPFHYHRRDWKTAETGRAQAPLSFSELAEEQFMSVGPVVTEQVDHRYQSRYYESTSLISLLPEGGIVIRDGFGGEIRMVGGNIDLSCPGDITFRSGRSTIVYAGDDAIIRARNSVDVTAANHDVRLKAEHNLDLLAGNGGQTGRLLLDCQATGELNEVIGKQGEEVAQTGIILKAAKAPVSLYGFSIYLRTGADDTSLGGPIILDANQGRSTVRVNTQQLLVHAQTGMNLAVPGDNVQLVYSFGRESCLMPTSVQMEGGLTILKNGIQCRGNVNVMSGSVSTENSKSGTMGYLEPGKPPWTITNQNLDQVSENFSTLKESLTEAYETTFTEGLYASGQRGEKRTIVNTQFAPRTPAQMRSQNYVIVQSYWQQLAAVNGGGTQVWQEPVIAYQGEQMMPHPGKSRWENDEAFLQPELKLFNQETGYDAPRSQNGSAYESLEPAAWTPSAPANNYHVIT
jgi:hypothetical protein